MSKVGYYHIKCLNSHLLQKWNQFVKEINRLVNDQMFNRHSIADIPESPTHGHKKNPYNVPRASRQAVNNSSELAGPCWVPLIGQQFPNTSPHKLINEAEEKIYRLNFQNPHRGHSAVGRPQPFMDVVTRCESSPNNPPQDVFYSAGWSNHYIGFNR